MKKRLALLIVLIAAIVIAVLWWRENRSYDGPVQQVTASSEQIARGRYLTQAADCAACHTAAGGAPLAGGYPLDTPFGTIYGSNLTPSADQGIGRWTKDDFFLALTQGVAPGGRHLYPAMPYTSYKGISREDADAIYAYLMSRPAVDVAIPANDMPFPFNQRMALIGWNLLFRNSDPLPASSQGSSAEWQRGRYLSDVLGHCGECHTPRGMLGQMEVNKPMQGGDLGRFIAPDITPQALAQRGWTPEDLSRFLSTGLAPQGSAFSEMHMVVDLSTRHLTPEDHRALVTYLMGDKPPQPVAVKIGQGSDAGRITYLDQCSACHERDGAGIPHVAVAMRDNATLRQPDGKNLIVSVLDGLPAQQFPGNESMQSMPGFADRLDDAQIAELVNYLRVTWGGLPADITAEQVKALRKAH
ncbi:MULTISPECIES: c-type cytochrome [Serratia]|uniref:c-type cytochrome n=1 Tax=Serratia TaxID=613 RepID=UPI000742EF3E|nr:MULTISPECIES: cytochrome c [Serratia]ALX96711.1 cytochrome C oxidase Cbb3 [Serratia fonticola]MBP1036034.1 c-type cytochrome [Serratia fonticola]UAN50600.1 c-type cytochrome [Serratia sp. JSRIV002]CAI0769461.1 Gluconate 2-dehydrogenase cytochrome c subunit precursor [Serratia fonticola]